MNATLAPRTLSAVLSVNATICLYGTHDRGFFFLADAANGVSVEDETRTFSLTAVVWMAKKALSRKGVEGEVVVFLPGGEKMAKTSVESIEYFGDLKFVDAPVLSVRL